MFENNVLCKLLNIKYPIFQGGMAWIGTAELASAVSNAGGLGIIGAGHMPPDLLRAEIQKAKKFNLSIIRRKINNHYLRSLPYHLKQRNVQKLKK